MCAGHLGLPTQLLQLAVVEMDHRGGREPKDYRRDDVLPLQAILEDAVAVAIFAFTGLEHTALAGSHLNGFHLLYDGLHFHAVSPDVLHGGGAHFAWNVR